MGEDDLLPEVVYETYVVSKDKLCLACGKDKAQSILRSTERELVPLCSKCAIGWNFYGYNVLKKTKPVKLIWNLFTYKYWHWFTSPPVWEIFFDLKKYSEWGKKMKEFQKRRKAS